MTSSRSGNAADARPPPRPAGLRPPRVASLPRCSLQKDAQNILLELGLGRGKMPSVREPLACIIHEGSTAAADMGMLSGVLGLSALWVPDIMPICAASLRTLMNNAG
jgi:hypothetical protein